MKRQIAFRDLPFEFRSIALVLFVVFAELLSCPAQVVGDAGVVSFDAIE